jgi:hypothetical protein
MGNLTDYLFVFTNGSVDANWQSASKGYIGNVAVNGVVASERTSGTIPYAGTIYTNNNTLGPYQNIINANTGQASYYLNESTRLTNLKTDLENAFKQINALTTTSGYSGVSAMSLDGLNTQNGINQTFVINITSGFQVSNHINITGDAGDLFVLRWDNDANFSNGYNGQVKFQSGGAIIPLGGLKPTNFISVAGDINSSGGGSNPALPFPQGPRINNGTGSLINGGSNFNGGGFFTGYWLTTGTPTIAPAGEQPYGKTAAQSNGIFVGGWYTKTTEFSLTGGSSGVYIQPNSSLILTSLPVKMISFSAVLNNPDIADLKWTTTSEVNVSYFVIEKSYEGKNFSDAGLVFAYGNTSEKVNYSFADNINSTQQNVIYYRLRSVDNDGKSQFSEVRIIRTGKQDEMLKMVTYPNPVSNELRITIPANWQNKQVVYELFGANGNMTKKSVTGNSSQTEILNVSSLAPGFYFVQATCNGENAQQKIIKQ